MSLKSRADFICVRAKQSTIFSRTLPTHQSELAAQILKDPYIFDHLELSEEAHERDLEKALMTHLKEFLLELGSGFAFVGSQMPMCVGEKEFCIDLLFYHLRVRCFVVIDLKMRDFEAEFASKVNMYLSAIDDKLRHPDDNQTVGSFSVRGVTAWLLSMLFATSENLLALLNIK